PPLSVERNTPPPVPANRLVPLTASAETLKFVKPLLTAVQLPPLSVERNTPPPKVPANRLMPLTAKHCTEPPPGPEVATHGAADPGLGAVTLFLLQPTRATVDASARISPTCFIPDLHYKSHPG